MAIQKRSVRALSTNPSTPGDVATGDVPRPGGKIRRVPGRSVSTSPSSPLPILPGVVQDWGGFEKLIADMHSTGTVSVQRDVKLIDMYGASHQIDVLVTHKQGLHEHKTIVECKLWNTKIKRVHVDAMAHSIHSLGVSNGAFFSTKGYQSGAKKVAEKTGIGIFSVRELAPSEWGGPARVWDFWLQYVYRAFGPLMFQGLIVAVPGQPLPSAPVLELCLGPENATSTPVFNASGTPQEDTLESLLDRASFNFIEKNLPPGKVAGDGDRGVGFVLARVNMPFDPPLQIRLGDTWIMCPQLEFDLGIKIEQVRYVYDRANAFVYALAVENCISGESHALGRRRESGSLDMNPIWPLPGPLGASSSAGGPSSEPAKHKGDEFKNGSVLRIITRILFNMSEMDGLPHHPIPPPAAAR